MTYQAKSIEVLKGLLDSLSENLQKGDMQSKEQLSEIKQLIVNIKEEFTDFFSQTDEDYKKYIFSYWLPSIIEKLTNVKPNDLNVEVSENDVAFNQTHLIQEILIHSVRLLVDCIKLIKDFKPYFLDSLKFIFNYECIFHSYGIPETSESVQEKPTYDDVEWRRHLNVGDMIDAIYSPNHRIQGWTQGVITQIDEPDTIHVNFIYELTDPTTEFERGSQEIAPYKQKTQDLWEMKNNLEPFDNVDVHDLTVWNNATILELSQQENNNNTHTIRTAHIAYRIYSIGGAKSDENGTYDGWSTRFDEWVPLFSPRIQMYKSKVSKSSNDHFKIDDKFDHFYKSSDGFEQIYVLPRLEYSQSKTYLYLINLFGNLGGFDEFLRLLENNERNLTMRQFFAFMENLSQILPFFHKNYINHYGIKIIDYARQFVGNYTQQNDTIKNDELKKLLQQLKQIMSRTNLRLNIQNESQLFTLGFCLINIQQGKIINAILVINQVISFCRYHQNKNTLTLHFMQQWLEKHNIIDIMLKDSNLSQAVVLNCEIILSQYYQDHPEKTIECFQELIKKGYKLELYQAIGKIIDEPHSVFLMKISSLFMMTDINLDTDDLDFIQKVCQIKNNDYKLIIQNELKELLINHKTLTVKQYQVLIKCILEQPLKLEFEANNELLIKLENEILNHHHIGAILLYEGILQKVQDSKPIAITDILADANQEVPEAELKRREDEKKAQQEFQEFFDKILDAIAERGMIKSLINNIIEIIKQNQKAQPDQKIEQAMFYELEIIKYLQYFLKMPPMSLEDYQMIFTAIEDRIGTQSLIYKIFLEWTVNQLEISLITNKQLLDVVDIHDFYIDFLKKRVPNFNDLNKDEFALLQHLILNINQQKDIADVKFIQKLGIIQIKPERIRNFSDLYDSDKGKEKESILEEIKSAKQASQRFTLFMKNDIDSIISLNVLWDILLNTQDVIVQEMAFALIFKFYNILSDISYREQNFKNLVLFLDKCYFYLTFTNDASIQLRIIEILNKLLIHSEKIGQKYYSLPLKCHFHKKIIKNLAIQTPKKETLMIKCFQNISIWQLKQWISETKQYEPYYYDLEIGGQTVTWENNFKTLSDYNVKSGDTITLKKNSFNFMDEAVVEEKFLDENDQLTLQADRLFNRLFERYCDENQQMHRSGWVQLILDVTGEKAREDDERINGVLRNYDTNQDDIIEREDFLSFYRTGCKNKKDVVRENMKWWKIRKDFSFEEDFFKQTYFEKEKIPRFLMSNDQQYFGTLLQLAERNKSAQLGEKIWLFIQELAPREFQKEVVTSMLEAIPNSDQIEQLYMIKMILIQAQKCDKFIFLCDNTDLLKVDNQQDFLENLKHTNSFLQFLTHKIHSFSENIQQLTDNFSILQFESSLNLLSMLLNYKSVKGTQDEIYDKIDIDDLMDDLAKALKHLIDNNDSQNDQDKDNKENIITIISHIQAIVWCLIINKNISALQFLKENEYWQTFSKGLLESQDYEIRHIFMKGVKYLQKLTLDDTSTMIPIIKLLLDQSNISCDLQSNEYYEILKLLLSQFANDQNVNDNIHQLALYIKQEEIVLKTVKMIEEFLLKNTENIYDEFGRTIQKLSSSCDYVLTLLDICKVGHDNESLYLSDQLIAQLFKVALPSLDSSQVNKLVHKQYQSNIIENLRKSIFGMLKFAFDKTPTLVTKLINEQIIPMGKQIPYNIKDINKTSIPIITDLSTTNAILCVMEQLYQIKELRCILLSSDLITYGTQPQLQAVSSKDTPLVVIVSQYLAQREEGQVSDYFQAIIDISQLLNITDESHDIRAIYDIIIKKLENELALIGHQGLMKWILGNVLCKHITCQDCGIINEEYNETFAFDIDLDIHQTHNLEQFMKSGIDEKVIADHHCNFCKQKAESKQIDTYAIFPNILTVNFKHSERESQQEDINQKKSPIPQFLDLGDFAYKDTIKRDDRADFGDKFYPEHKKLFNLQKLSIDQAGFEYRLVGIILNSNHFESQQQYRNFILEGLKTVQEDDNWDDDSRWQSTGNSKWIETLTNGSLKERSNEELDLIWNDINQDSQSRVQMLIYEKRQKEKYKQKIKRDKKATQEEQARQPSYASPWGFRDSRIKALQIRNIIKEYVPNKECIEIQSNSRKRILSKDLQSLCFNDFLLHLNNLIINNNGAIEIDENGMYGFMLLLYKVFINHSNLEYQKSQSQNQDILSGLQDLINKYPSLATRFLNEQKDKDNFSIFINNLINLKYEGVRQKSTFDFFSLISKQNTNQEKAMPLHQVSIWNQFIVKCLEDLKRQEYSLQSRNNIFSIIWLMIDAQAKIKLFENGEKYYDNGLDFLVENNFIQIAFDFIKGKESPFDRKQAHSFVEFFILYINDLLEIITLILGIKGQNQIKQIDLDLILSDDFMRLIQYQDKKIKKNFIKALENASKELRINQRLIKLQLTALSQSSHSLTENNQAEDIKTLCLNEFGECIYNSLLPETFINFKDEYQTERLEQILGIPQIANKQFKSTNKLGLDLVTHLNDQSYYFISPLSLGQYKKFTPYLQQIINFSYTRKELALYLMQSLLKVACENKSIMRYLEELPPITYQNTRFIDFYKHFAKVYSIEQQELIQSYNTDKEELEKLALLVGKIDQFDGIIQKYEEKVIALKEIDHLLNENESEIINTLTKINDIPPQVLIKGFNKDEPEGDFIEFQDQNIKIIIQKISCDYLISLPSVQINQAIPTYLQLENDTFEIKKEKLKPKELKKEIFYEIDIYQDQTEATKKEELQFDDKGFLKEETIEQDKLKKELELKQKQEVMKGDILIRVMVISKVKKQLQVNFQLQQKSKTYNLPKSCFNLRMKPFKRITIGYFQRSNPFMESEFNKEDFLVQMISTIINPTEKLNELKQYEKTTLNVGSQTYQFTLPQQICKECEIKKKLILGESFCEQCEEIFKESFEKEMAGAFD